MWEFSAAIFAILMESLHLLLALIIAKTLCQGFISSSRTYSTSDSCCAMGIFIFAFIISNLLREKETQKERDLYFDELERKRHELKVANKIQKSFLPDEIPVVPGFDIAALNIPTNEVGSDFYDFIQLTEHKVGIVIADVAGDSFPASLLMALSHTILKGEAKIRAHHIF